jgi:hypothetical protein
MVDQYPSWKFRKGDVEGNLRLIGIDVWMGGLCSAEGRGV